MDGRHYKKIISDLKTSHVSSQPPSKLQSSIIFVATGREV